MPVWNKSGAATMSAAPDPELFWHFVTDGGGFAGALLTRRECQISGVFFPEIKQYDTGECQRISTRLGTCFVSG